MHYLHRVIFVYLRSVLFLKCVLSFSFSYFWEIGILFSLYFVLKQFLDFDLIDLFFSKEKGINQQASIEDDRIQNFGKQFSLRN